MPWALKHGDLSCSHRSSKKADALRLPNTWPDAQKCSLSQPSAWTQQSVIRTDDPSFPSLCPQVVPALSRQNIQKPRRGKSYELWNKRERKHSLNQKSSLILWDSLSAFKKKKESIYKIHLMLNFSGTQLLSIYKRTKRFSFLAFLLILTCQRESGFAKKWFTLQKCSGNFAYSVSLGQCSNKLLEFLRGKGKIEREEQQT